MRALIPGPGGVYSARRAAATPCSSRTISTRDPVVAEALGPFYGLTIASWRGRGPCAYGAQADGRGGGLTRRWRRSAEQPPSVSTGARERLALAPKIVGAEGRRRHGLSARATRRWKVNGNSRSSRGTSTGRMSGHPLSGHGSPEHADARRSIEARYTQGSGREALLARRGGTPSPRASPATGSSRGLPAGRVELKGLSGGVRAKLDLWRALRAIAPEEPRLDQGQLDQLIGRAELQLEGLASMQARAAALPSRRREPRFPRRWVARGPSMGSGSRILELYAPRRSTEAARSQVAGCSAADRRPAASRVSRCFGVKQIKLPAALSALRRPRPPRARAQPVLGAAGRLDRGRCSPGRPPRRPRPSIASRRGSARR